jgi:hypothetical protein
MHTFFHGWRRKAGVVTLVMSCIVTPLWIRSRYRVDLIEIHCSDSTVILASTEGRFAAVRNMYIQQSSFNPSERSVKLGALPVRSTAPFMDRQHITVDWRWWNGATLKSTSLLGGDPADRMVSYWTIVLPLTLLSAYLILWKPRKRDAT